MEGGGPTLLAINSRKEQVARGWVGMRELPVLGCPSEAKSQPSGLYHLPRGVERWSATPRRGSELPASLPPRLALFCLSSKTPSTDGSQAALPGLAGLHVPGLGHAPSPSRASVSPSMEPEYDDPSAPSLFRHFCSSVCLSVPQSVFCSSHPSVPAGWGRAVVSVGWGQEWQCSFPAINEERASDPPRRGCKDLEL